MQGKVVDYYGEKCQQSNVSDSLGSGEDGEQRYLVLIP